MRLKGKNIYYIITGASKAKYAEIIIREIIKEGANVFTIPTKSGEKFIDLKILKNIKNNIIKTDWSEKIKLPREDAVLIAPCTFNTLNAIAQGRADSYCLCLIASAIGNKSPIFIAPSMNKSLWNNPVTQESMKKLEFFGCRIIWPKILPDKVTMINTKKILDSLFFSFKRIAFKSKKNGDKRLQNKLHHYQKKYIGTFNKVGDYLSKNKLNLPTAGCMSIKVPGGFIISRSGCDITHVREDDISLVVSWNEKLNKIEWTGKKSPSSETPLHCVIRKNINKKIILHIHYPRMTYSNNLSSLNSNKYCRYGTFNIGYEILNILIKNSFAIMKYHGEVIIGDDIKEIKSNLTKYLKKA